MRTMLTVAFALATVFLETPASAGPAGMGESSTVAYLQDDAIDSAWRDRVEQARARYEAFAALAARKYFSSLTPSREGDAKRAGLFPILLDPTLRVGDIYATEQGFLIFRGRLGFVHLQSDFTPMPDARARNLSLAIGWPP